MNIPSDAAMIYEDFLTYCAPVLGDTLLAVYATGSIAHGAYMPGRSDVDGLVILTEDWRDRCDRTLLDSALNRLQKLHSETNLQLQFASIQYMLKHMPFVDVVDWQTYGVLVHGTEVRGELPQISHEMLRLDMLLCFLDRYTGVCESGRILPYGWDAVSDGAIYSRHPSMLALWIIQPARIIYTWDTGAITSKGESVSWFKRRHPGPSSEWMQQVLAWREAGFPDTEQMVMGWGPQIPALTARLAAFLLDKLSGGTPRFDDLILERPLTQTLSGLSRIANEWLVSVPACQRYTPLSL